MIDEKLAQQIIQYHLKAIIRLVNLTGSDLQEPLFKLALASILQTFASQIKHGGNTCVIELINNQTKEQTTC